MSHRTRIGQRMLATAGVLLLCSFPVWPATAVAPTTERLSVDSGAGGGRELPATSADANRTVFVGRGSTNQGLWLRDRTAATTYRLTTGAHFNPAISADGNTVAYVVYGTTRSVWVMDITNPASPGVAQRVDIANGASGTPSDGLSDFPSLNGDGTLVAFQSTAKNLTPATPTPTSGGPEKVYVRNLVANTTEMVSVDGAGVALPGSAVKPDLTPDGRYVAFASTQVLTTPPILTVTRASSAGRIEAETTTETFQQVYVHDRTAHLVTVASVGTTGALGNAGSALVYGPTISDDGQRVAFESDATNLVLFDTNGRTDSFVRDLTAHTTVRVSERTAVDELGPLTAVTPVRLVDTRVANAPLGTQGTLTLKIRGHNGVPATATAVALNVTAVSVTALGFVTVYPASETRPLASNLNLTPGAVVTNAVTAKLGTNGDITIFNYAGIAHLIVDLNGYYDSATSVSASGGGFTAMTPARLLDTRVLGQPLTGGETRKLQVAGVAGVPSTATAVSLNVTAVSPTTGGYLTVFPTGGAAPLASSVNFVAGQVIPNSVIAKLGTDGSISIFNFAGSTHVVVDVTGFAAPEAVNGGMTTVVPSRLLDTRTAGVAMGGTQTLDLGVIGVGGVPAENVTAVVLNVTTITPTLGGYLTVYPAGVARPLTSNLNFTAGSVRSNQVLVAVGDNGKVSLFNSAGNTHVVVDVAGWFSGAQTAEGGGGPAITGDGTGVAFESLSSTMAAGDTNGVKDAFIRILSTKVTERVSVAIAGGTEATGTRIDGNTGLVVPVVNGGDVSVGLSPSSVVFVSSGDLAKDRVVGEEVAGEISTEPAVYLRSR